MMTDPRTRTVIIGLEARKLVRATVTRVATVACLVLVTVTTAGGYAAAMRASDTDIGRKAASLVTSPGWGGYTGLGATSVSVTMLLAAGVVMSWSVGREFTDGTIVGLFSIPPALRAIVAAKMAATHWRGYLAGIGFTLAILVATNLAAGFGLGACTPWSIPVVWAARHEEVSTLLLVAPVVAGAIGAWLTLRSWDRLQLGAD